MERIVIVGPSGAGKTMLARELGPMLKIKTFHLDRFFWGRDWKEKTSYLRKELLEKLVFGEKRWIIEGSYLASSEPGLMEADTIIFLDLPPLLCFWRVLKRHYQDHGLRRRDIPEGCTDRITPWHLLKVLIFPFRGRRKVKQTLSNYSTKHIIRLHSKKAVNDFLAQLEQAVDDERNSSFVVSCGGVRILATRIMLRFHYSLARKSVMRPTML